MDEMHLFGEVEPKNFPLNPPKSVSEFKPYCCVQCLCRQGLLPTYSAANLGFRCGESAREPPKPVVRHRLIDTWDYKVKQILAGVVGSFRKSAQLADEL